MVLASSFFCHSWHQCSAGQLKSLILWAAIPFCGLSHIRLFIIIPLAPAGQRLPTRLEQNRFFPVLQLLISGFP